MRIRKTKISLATDFLRKNDCSNSLFKNDFCALFYCLEFLFFDHLFFDEKSMFWWWIDICVAYTMKHMGLNVHEAYQYVKKCRPQISPNIAFMGQLIEYQNIINGAKVKDDEKAETPTAISPQRILPPVVVNKDTQPKGMGGFFFVFFIKCKTNILKGAPKDRSGLRLSLDLNRKRKRSSDISSIPVRSKKRPTLLLLSSTTTSPAPLPGPSGIFSGPSSSPKCAKIISKSDPISSPHKMEMFATKNVVRKINSDSDLDKVNQNQPLKFSARIRHGSAGEFNESDWLGNKSRGPCKCSLANAFFTTKPSYAETSPFKAYHVDYLTLWRKMQFMHLNLPFAKFGPILSRAIVQLLSSGLFLNRLLLDFCHRNHLISAS